MTITINDLPAILEEHRLWLRNEEGARANLARANLARANLSGAYLAGANLARANLAGADLSGANLSGANLSSANLSMANLSRANLSGANLAGANLARANLAGADLSGAEGISREKVQPLLMLLDQVGKIRAYKLVTASGHSPMHGNLHYPIKGMVDVGNANTDVNELCAAGVNVATLDWCLNEWRPSWRIMVVEFTAKDIACIPTASDGKFRLHRCKVVGEKDLVKLGLVEAEEQQK